MTKAKDEAEEAEQTGGTAEPTEEEIQKASVPEPEIDTSKGSSDEAEED